MASIIVYRSVQTGLVDPFTACDIEWDGGGRISHSLFFINHTIPLFMEDVNGYILSFSQVSGSASLSSRHAAINITNIQITLFNIHGTGGQEKSSQAADCSVTGKRHVEMDRWISNE